MQTEQIDNVIHAPIRNALHRYKTKAGLDAVIFFEHASTEYPYLGMYFTEGEWYPSRWDLGGNFIHELETGLSLILPNTIIDQPLEAA